MTIRDSVVRNSSTPGRGGGIANRGGALIVERSTLSGNSAESGGGIFNDFGGQVTIEASTLRSNLAGDGGGLWSTGGSVTVRDSTISGNSGRGITIVRGPSQMVNSTISGNRGDGLLLFNDSFGGPHALNSCTIANNAAHGIETSHFSLGSGPVTVNNSIAAGNGGFDCLGVLMSAGHNLVQKIAAPLSNPACLLQGDSAGNLIGVDAKLGLLADNGGPTKTHALLAGSLAIDAGDPAAPGSGGHSCAATDQRGEARPLGTTCDIGAFEARREFSVSGMLPSAAGNAVETLSLVYGSGFASGATVKLTRAGETDLAGSRVTVSEDGSVIAARFDLAGTATGPWDLVVTNPGGAEASRARALTLTDSAQAQVWMDVLGPPAMRTLRTTTFRIAVGNLSDIDAFAVPLVVILPGNYAWSLRFQLAPPLPLPGTPIDWNDVPVAAIPEQPGTTVVFLLLPVVPAGFTGFFPFSITAPEDGEYLIAYEIGKPYVEHGVTPRVTESLAAMAVAYARDVLQVEIPAERLADVRQHVASQLEDLVARGQQAWLDSLATSPQVVALTHVLIDAALFAAPPQTQTPLAHAFTAAADGPVGDAAAGLGPADCKQIQRQGGVLLPGQFGHGNGDCSSDRKRPRRGPVDRSRDPNDKGGSDGSGTARYVAGDEPLRYVISFENVETARFPAQEVVITDQLDVASVDLDTFSLGPISFGEREIVPPPGLQTYARDLDLRPEHPFAVRIHAGVNPASGLATWRFTAIDPTTGELPEDPRVGFLPPNVTAPQGEGSVVFTVKVKPGVPTDTEIANAASIVFDDNPPLATATWRNTIDRDVPASAVTALPPMTRSPSFDVSWGGTDSGSGIGDFTVFVAEDGGPFAIWQAATSDLSARFEGVVGHRYAFYSLARDGTGNLEPPPGAPDAETRITRCPGDCDSNGTVVVAELIRGVNIALGNQMVENCPAFDDDASGTVGIAELILAVNAALSGCP